MRLVVLVALALAPTAAAHPGDGVPEVHATSVAGSFAFDPPEATLLVGQRLRWWDESGHPHTATSVASLRDATPDGRFDGTFAPGAPFEVAFDEAGEFAYVCLRHAGMVGLVRVLANAPGPALGVTVLALAFLVAGRRAWTGR